MDTPLEENNSSENNNEEMIEEVVEPSLLDESEAGGTEAGGSEAELEEASLKVEAKIRELIELMKQALSQAGRPKFKEFWDARIRCVDLLKMPMGLGVRQMFWGEVTSLSKEARNLKQFFDKDVSYEIDQIQLAFETLEQQVDALPSSDRRLPLIPENVPSYVLAQKDFFEILQAKLQHMQGMLSQVQALRKEILSSTMRAKTKSSMLDRSSKLLDALFSMKRDWTGQISNRYQEVVSHFVQLYPKDMIQPRTTYEIKEEIKLLQSLGKFLSITPDVFLRVREILSQKWDEIKEIEHDIRESIAQRKSQFKAFVEDFSNQCEEFAAFCLLEEANAELVKQKHTALFDVLKTKELDRETFKQLKGQLLKAKEPFDQKLFKLQQAEKEEAERADREIRQKFDQLKMHFEDLLHKQHELPLEHLQESYEKAKNEAANTKFASFHSQVLDHLAFQIEDVIQHAKDQKLLKLAPEDKEAHEQLTSLYEVKLKQRAELKKQLETSRKSLGTSGLDFEKAMALRERIEIEKQSFDRLNDLIGQIEEKLADLQNK